MVHVRIDGRDGRRHGQHRFERIAAFGKDLAAGFDGGGMGRANDAAAVAGAVQVHDGQLAAVDVAKPRCCNSASALGSRPRNAL